MKIQQTLLNKMPEQSAKLETKISRNARGPSLRLNTHKAILQAQVKPILWVVL
jgi:hypothetical protein